MEELKGKVEALGIKELLPTYLDPNLRPEELPTGVSIASVGSGYDFVTANIQRAMPMSAQLNLSKEYIANLKDAVREEKADSTLSNSLHLVSAGNNDIAISYYFTRLWLALGFAAYSDLLIDAASNFTKELPDATLTDVDVYGALFNLIQNPYKSGFQVVKTGCCHVQSAGIGVLCKLIPPHVSRYVFWDGAHLTERA
ncbi:hypothetical protein CRG98_004506 [Punica granatum]|uniref:GDSL esterase/lipase n=1 Tax=Punica granatum TaxID=22663 RepID=A0A2I0L385_PUNGR|nr:hypothetical protein CRG98_004506 [Punica granatum]